MRATTEPLEGNKIRLSVEVEETEVDRAVDDMVRTLSRRARVPGFRPGKVPRRVLEARMGGIVAIREEAIREALPDFYAQAVTDVEADPIAPPSIDIKSGEEAGPVVFEATVEVRPIVSVPGYAGLAVTIPSPEVSEEDVQEQVDRLLETDAELEPVRRPAREGDNVTLDLHAKDDQGNEIIATDDFNYELGSGSVVPELDTELGGKSVGDIFDFRAGVPDGRRASFRVLVKEIQRKVLPELTDEWVEENTDSSTAEDLRASMRKRIGDIKLLQARMAQRDGALRALADLVEDDVVPAVLVDEALADRVQGLEQRLGEQGVSVQDFLQATGRNAEDFVAELRQEALGVVKADLALRAVAEAESLEVSDEEFESGLDEMAERLGVTPQELRQRLHGAGQTTAVRSEQRKAKALTWILDHVELVDPEGKAVSREVLAVESDQPDGETPSEGESAPAGPQGAEEDVASGDEGEAAASSAPASEAAALHGTVTVAGDAEEGS